MRTLIALLFCCATMPSDAMYRSEAWLATKNGAAGSHAEIDIHPRPRIFDHTPRAAEGAAKLKAKVEAKQADVVATGRRDGWRSLTTEEIASGTCTVASGTLTVTQNPSGTFNFYDIPNVPHSTTATAWYCDWSVAPLSFTNVRTSAEIVSFHPITGAAQHPDDNDNMTVWGEPIPDSHNGYFSMGTPATIVDPGGHMGVNVASGTWQSGPSASAVPSSSTVRLGFSQSFWEENFYIRALNIEVFEATPTSSPTSSPTPGPTDTYFVINTGMGWQEAENECVSQGGHLASITSQAENGVVSALCATSVCVGEGCQQWQASPFCWIGGKKLADDLQSGAFNWTDGTTETTYTNKDHNHQFVGVPDQPYLAMRRGTGTWQFEHVGLTYTAVCERQVVAQAVGDPHMTNILGQRFDLARPGVHLLVQVPQRAGPRGALLIVSAEVRLMGPSCSDMYIQKLNITGRWTRRRGTTRYMARSGHIPKGWHHFGKVDLKVVRGTTNTGIKYLNFLTRRLANTGLAVGGLLGGGDHSLASARLPGCIKTLAL